MFDVEVIKKMKVAKTMCMRSLLWHTRYFFKAQYKRKFVVGRHHEIMCAALEQVLTGKLTRLIINIAPRYSKTEVAVKNFISHGLTLNQAAKFIHLSYADNLALDNSETIKDLIQSDEFQIMFPEVQIKKDARAKDKWYTTAGGGVLARAAAGQVTGFGAGQVDEESELDEFMVQQSNEGETQLDKKFNFGGAIIIDDPIKPEDADSDTIREKVNQRFDSTIRNRTNSRNTPIIIIMQRLHPMDLCGYLLSKEPDVWTVISLPCLQEDGSALWEFKHTVAELKELKRLNDVIFERQYQQNPKARAGLMFPIEDLNFYKYEPEMFNDPETSYMPVDPANLGGDDFAALDLKLIGNKIYVVNVLYNTEGADVNEEAVVNMIIDGDVRFAGVEGVFGWADTAVRIRSELADKDFDCELRILRPRTNKLVRIHNRSSFIRNNFYFREDYNEFPQYAKFMQNLTSYLKIQAPGLMNKHDEAPDVCEMGAAYFEKTYPNLW